MTYQQYEKMVGPAENQKGNRPGLTQKFLMKM